MSDKNNTQQYLAMWCTEGFECLINVTAQQSEDVMAVLGGEQPKGIPLEQMRLRARFNSQRHYEIYTFSSVIPEEDLKTIAFGKEPQVLVDAIRNCGTQIYSDRAKERTQVIV